MRNIQFHHKRIKTLIGYDIETREGFQEVYKLEAKGGTTLCLEVPSIEEFDALQPSLKTPVVFKFGVAECSTKDHYNKKIGREIALGRLKDTFFFVTSKSQDQVQLAGGGFVLVLRKYENRVRVYFEGVIE